MQQHFLTCYIFHIILTRAYFRGRAFIPRSSENNTRAYFRRMSYFPKKTVAYEVPVMLDGTKLGSRK